MDIIGSKVTLSIPEFGIVNVMATVKAIKPTQIDTRGVNWSKQKSAPVIGKFMHYVTDVRTYTFKDSLGHISHINATPNHPFYVKNKHGFVAIGNVSDDDTLVGDVGSGDNHIDGAMHLVCAKGKHSHYGEAFMGNGLPVSVYNLEVYRRHVYRVGVLALLVHNGCDWRSGLGVKNLDELENYQIGDITNRYVKSRIEYSSTRELAINGFKTDQSNRINRNINLWRSRHDDPNDYINIQCLLNFGNCSEHAQLGISFLRKNGFSGKIEMMALENGDHAFIRINGETLNSYIIDPWRGNFYSEKFIGIFLNESMYRTGDKNTQAYPYVSRSFQYIDDNYPMITRL